MFRRLSLVAFLAGLVTLAAIPAGAHVGRHASRADVDQPNLDEAYYSLEDAEWHEDNAGGELVFGCTGCAIGELLDSNRHLRDALGHVSAAASVGEIAPDEAAAISAKLNDAIAADSRSLELIGAGQFRDALAAFDAASAAKEDAEDLINGYPQDTGVDLGCKLFLQSNPYPGDTAVGLDGCTAALSGISVLGVYPFKRVSPVTIGSDQFPCRHTAARILCDHPVQTGQEVFLSFDTPQLKTLDKITAQSTDGHVQEIPFTIGTEQPVADTGAVASLHRVTPRGFGFGLALKLQQGGRYAYDLEATNDGPGAAFGAQLQVTIPPTFALESFPKTCTPSGTVITCPFDRIRPFEGISPSIVGRPTKTGPIQFKWVVTSSAKEPSPDKIPNTGSTKVVVYPVPVVKIKKISRSIKLGRPGVISGIAGVDVKKVQLGILLKTVNPAKVCKWLGPGGKLVSVAPFAAACDKGVWLDVKGALKWEFKVKLGLPKGSYYVLGRGTGTDGITGTLFKMSDWSLDQFKVK